MTLPNFIVIGAFKSGTTSMYHYLNEHPEIFMSSVKETNFFAYDGGKPAETVWGTRIDRNVFLIRSFEAYLNLFRGVSDEKAIGEVSPLYFMSAMAPGNIKKYVPDVKLIAILRNPVDRAYSAYLMHVRKGYERRNVEQIFENPLEERVVRAGFYFLQLRRYFDLFTPARIAVYLFEKFKSNTVDVIGDVYHFLGVNESFVPGVGVVHNPGGLPRNRILYRLLVPHPFLASPRVSSIVNAMLPKPIRKLRSELRNRHLVKVPELPTEIRKRLIEVYRDDVIQLQDLIQQDLSHWLEI